jgi:hypothetical protein
VGRQCLEHGGIAIASQFMLSRSKSDNWALVTRTNSPLYLENHHHSPFIMRNTGNFPDGSCWENVGRDNWVGLVPSGFWNGSGRLAYLVG